VSAKQLNRVACVRGAYRRVRLKASEIIQCSQLTLQAHARRRIELCDSSELTEGKHMVAGNGEIAAGKEPGGSSVTRDATGERQ
jgi:hypothetical protein